MLIVNAFYPHNRGINFNIVVWTWLVGNLLLNGHNFEGKEEDEKGKNR